MEKTTQTPERIANLKRALEMLNKAEVTKLTPQKRTLFLQGFCLGRFNEDIIYQMCYSFGRDVLTEIEGFLKEHDNEQ